MSKVKPVIIYDADGNEVAKYVSIKACAKALDITPATLTYRISKGDLFDGCLFEYQNAEDKVTIPKSFRQKPKVKELDYDRFRILDYETKNNRICITPCPFREGVNHVFIGSAKCQQCTSFRGLDREKHKIACNYNQWSKQTIKAWKEN